MHCCTSVCRTYSSPTVPTKVLIHLKGLRGYVVHFYDVVVLYRTIVESSLLITQYYKQKPYETYFYRTLSFPLPLLFSSMLLHPCLEHTHLTKITTMIDTMKEHLYNNMSWIDLYLAGLLFNSAMFILMSVLLSADKRTIQGPTSGG